MSAEPVHLNLWHVDAIVRGKPSRMAESVPRDTAVAFLAGAPFAGTGIRVYRAGREKPLPLKLAHSIRPSRASGESANHSLAQKAALVAEHIKAKNLTLVTLYRGRYHGLREFNEHLLRAL